jgi:hypothetical protein
MKACEECKVVAPESAEFCPRCGRPLPDQTPDDVGPRADRLLAEANLHRIRGNHDTAVEKCTEALELQPGDPDVHSLLGDIYESQGKLEEAARWYQMAVELRPGHAIDEAKLERTRSRLENAKSAEQAAATASQQQAFLGASRLDKAIRYIVVFCVVAVLVLLAIGLVAWLFRQKPASEPATTAPVTRTPRQPEAAAPSPNPTISGPAIETLVRPAAEQQLLSNLATNPAISSHRLVVDDVTSDPRRRAFAVTFRIPNPPSPLTRLELLRDAAVVGAAAFAASPETTDITIRALVHLPGKYGPKEPHLVLVCDAARQASALDASRATEDQLRQLFSEQWWGPEVPR